MIADETCLIASSGAGNRRAHPTLERFRSPYGRVRHRRMLAAFGPLIGRAESWTGGQADDRSHCEGRSAVAILRVTRGIGWIASVAEPALSAAEGLPRRGFSKLAAFPPTALPPPYLPPPYLPPCRRCTYRRSTYRRTIYRRSTFRHPYSPDPASSIMDPEFESPNHPLFHVSFVRSSPLSGSPSLSSADGSRPLGRHPPGPAGGDPGECDLHRSPGPDPVLERRRDPDLRLLRVRDDGPVAGAALS